MIEANLMASGNTEYYLAVAHSGSPYLTVITLSLAAGETILGATGHRS